MRQVGASVEQDTAYPGWAPNPDSAVVRLAQEVLTEVTGHKAKVGFPSRTALSCELAVSIWNYADPASPLGIAAAPCVPFQRGIFTTTRAARLAFGHFICSCVACAVSAG